MYHACFSVTWYRSANVWPSQSWASEEEISRSEAAGPFAIRVHGGLGQEKQRTPHPTPGVQSTRAGIGCIIVPRV